MCSLLLSLPPFLLLSPSLPPSPLSLSLIASEHICANHRELYSLLTEVSTVHLYIIMYTLILHCFLLECYPLVKVSV